MSITLRTFGHGTASEEQLIELIRSHGLALVADVRSVPRSRAHPHVWRERMERWVPLRADAAYAWLPALGGFRKVRADSTNLGLRHASFRGYADYMQTPEFLEALEQLMTTSSKTRTAVMCSESVWWRCHRRLIADAAMLLHGAEVLHVMHDGKERPHQLTPGVVRRGDMLEYDIAVA